MTGLAGIYAAVGLVLLPVLVCTAVGVEWGRRKIAYPASFISTLVTSIAVPALVFHTLTTTRLATDTILSIVQATVLALAVMGVMSAVLLRLARLPVRALIPSGTFPNAGNLGLPLSQLAFGDQGLTIAVTCFAVCSFLQHTVGVYILSASSKHRGSWFSPVVLAALLAVGMQVAGIDAPAWAVASSKLLGQLTIPLMLISLGYTLITISHSGLRQGAYVGVMRLVVGVVGGTLVVKLLALPADIAGILLFQLMMPVAVVNYMYAQRYTDCAEMTAGSILVSTVLFLLLCPLALWYVGAGSMPGL